jgi:hypothetical protein
VKNRVDKMGTSLGSCIGELSHIRKFAVGENQWRSQSERTAQPVRELHSMPLPFKRYGIKLKSFLEWTQGSERKDPCGAWMNRGDYGLTTHLGCGWEIDHIIPASKRGPDDLANLQALQWENNRSKSDNELGWTCAVVSDAR